MKNIFILLLPLTFLLYPPQVSAKIGMSVSPPVTEVLISPNKSVSTSIQLTNEGIDTSVILSLHRLIPMGDQGHSTIDPKPLDPTSIPVVIKLVGKELGIPFALAAGQTQAITVQLEAANLDEPTDLYFALLAHSVNEGASPTESQATPGISTLFMVTITPSASLPTNVSLHPPDLPIIQDTTKSLEFEITAENKTAIMLQVQGKVKLIAPNKTIITESTFDPKLILGNTSRILSPFTFHLSPYYLGPHTVSIELLTIGGRTLTEHTYTVWLIPLRPLLVILTLLVLITIPIIKKFRLTMSTQKA